MIGRVLTLILAFFALAQAEARAETPYQLHPFTTDGCSAFPDGTLGAPHKWRHCCIQHDVAYWAGGTADDRIRADKALRECVAKTGENVLSHAMYYGVRAGGRATNPTTFHWGYGWTPERPYGALSVEEKEMVSKLTPKKPEETPIAIPEHYLEPSVFMALMVLSPAYTLQMLTQPAPPCTH